MNVTSDQLRRIVELCNIDPLISLQEARRMILAQDGIFLLRNPTEGES